jgi:hypothetical protein
MAYGLFQFLERRDRASALAGFGFGYWYWFYGPDPGDSRDTCGSL